MRHLLAVPLFTLSLLLVSCNLAPAADWVHWRGPAEVGISPERDLPDKWSPDPNAPDNNLIWKQPYGCRSTPLIMNGRLFFIGDVGQGPTQQERVVCLDAETGKKIWEHDFNVWQTAIVANRLGWTNLAGDPETGNVYAHGTQGLLMCYNRDGKLLWERSLTEEYGRVSGYGGRNASPIVDGDLVIIGIVQASWGDLGRGMNRFVAFDKKDGHVVWWSSPCDELKGTYYSNPVVTVINGQRLLITGGADGGLHALQVRTGKPVWKYIFGAQVINASPVVSTDGKVYCSHSEESPDGEGVQGRIICVDATKIKDGQPALVWKVDGIKAGYASPILDEANNRLYVPDDGASLHCFDAKTGDKAWKRPHKFGRLARGSPLLADGKIYVAEVNSKFHILQPGPNNCKDLHEYFFPGGAGGFVEINSTPAAVNGKVYFATRDEFYCIGKKDHKSPLAKLPAYPKEPAADPKAEVAAIQVVPADVVLEPGHSQTFTVRGYDKDGRFVKEIKDSTWSLPTPPLPPKATKGPPALAGKIEDGKLTVAKDRPVQAAYVEAALGKLTARARVRVVQALPMKFDFSRVPEGGVPSGWISAPAKYVVEKMPDGTMALKKLANNAAPPLARVFTYIGPPSYTDYTIQADILGKEVRTYLPDAGIVANRYTLLLDGKKDPNNENKRTLRIVSWDALPRVDKGVVFDWQPDVWYRLKLTVEVDKDKAHVRGKAWKASEKEPAKWTVEFEDALPNREGAPALYGYATGVLANAPGAEAFYNNVTVTPNKKVEAAK
jgi:outer membrane protein assembly factor BamB